MNAFYEHRLTPINRRRHRAAELGQMVEGLGDPEVGDVVGGRLRAEREVIADVLFHGAVPIVAADDRIRQVAIFDDGCELALVPLGDSAAVDHGELRRLADGAVCVEQTLAERIQGGAAIEDRIVTVLDLGEEQPVRAHPPFGRREERDEGAEPLLSAAFEVAGRQRTGLKLDHPRQLAVMHALVRFAHIAGGDTFTTRDLHPAAAVALDLTPDQYRLASLRYDLSKLRAKRFVEKIEHSRRYPLLPQGYRICVLFLKLFERVYAPLTAGLLRPVAADAALREEKRHRLDRLSQRIVTGLDALWCAVGLKVAS